MTLVGCGQSTARMASSNTVFRPRWVKAEHSRYFTASAWADEHKEEPTSIKINANCYSRASWSSNMHGRHAFYCCKTKIYNTSINSRQLRMVKTK